MPPVCGGRPPTDACFRICAKIDCMPEPSRHRSVERIDSVMDAVARSTSGLRLTEIAAALALPVSSTQDLLAELTTYGYLVRDGARYRAGPRNHVLAVLGGWTTPAGIGHERLAALSAAARAPVMLAVLAGTSVYYLDHAGPRAPSRLQDVVDLHRPRPPLRTAAGRLLLALGPSLPTSVRARLATSDARGWREYTHQEATIRSHRVARSDGLADPDIRAIAVPAGGTEPATAALVVTGRRRGPSDTSPTLDAAARRLIAALASGDDAAPRRGVTGT